MGSGYRALGQILAVCAALAGTIVPVRPAFASDADGSGDLPKIQGQLLELKANEAAEHARIDQDERLIRDLERRLEQLHKDNLKLDETSEHLTAANHQLADSTTQQIQNLQERIDSGVSATQFDSAMSRYLGTHEFTVVGDAAGGFIYDRATS